MRIMCLLYDMIGNPKFDPASIDTEVYWAERLPDNRDWDSFRPKRSGAKEMVAGGTGVLGDRSDLV